MFTSQMAAAQTLGAQTAAQPATQAPNAPAAQLTEAGLQASAELAAERELVSTSAPPQSADRIKPGSLVSRLPVEVDIALPVHEFRVRDLLSIAPGDIFETRWAQGEDMPLAAGRVWLAWSEFEVIETQLAVRVTRMA